MITKIEYNNFKILKDVCCNLTQLTVIVGPNASGKTSMLQGMQFLSQLSKKRSPEQISTIFGGPDSLDLVHSTDGETLLELKCFSDTEKFGFVAAESKSYSGLPRLPNSTWGAAVSRIHALSTQKPADEWQDRNSASEEISRVAFLQFEPKLMARPTYCEDLRPDVMPTGAGLATALASIALTNPDVFESLQNRLRQIVPHFRRLRFRRIKVSRDETEIIRIGEEAITRKVTREYPADMLIFDFDQRQDIPATNVSEGTLLALGLLTVLHSPSRPRIVLLDDIEKGLHPNAQRELIGMLRDILRDQPDLQIVATSHSPYFLDFLDPSEVRLMAIGPDGFSRCGLLTDHPDFPKWKDEMTPGEMWSFFGEKWLVEEKI